jgi:UDP-N-acetylmuramoyl-L-alanyl-D-glutamate--2,6-diaminopimelate ligase
MRSKKLSALLGPLSIIPGPRFEDPEITGLSYDSRQTREGNIFFALDGLHTNGHAFIERAVRAGARAVVHSRDIETGSPGIAYIKVEDPRSALSKMAAEFYDRPSRALKTIGVTGTDGKSSTVFFIYQLLEALGKPAGLLSTVSFIAGKELEKNPYRQSTPESPIIQEILRRMLDNGKEYAVIEATSHGLSRETGRLLDVEFDVGVLTNVTHEHLEFHGTYERYLSDKTNLFRSLNSRRSREKGVPCFGVANADDRGYGYIKMETREKLIAYSVCRTDIDIYAAGIRPDMEGTHFILHDGSDAGPVRIKIPGAFNVENVLAAAAAVSRLTGTSSLELIPFIEGLEGVRGRMTPVYRGQDFSVIVDYAHTPGAFERIFPMVKAYTPGKIIAVFGSGGERDREKRPIQGRIASSHAGVIVLADEDPRQENPETILEEIAAGCRGKTPGEDLFLIPDRREAIIKAFSLAGHGDTVLLLGKGHESSIIMKDGPVCWDEIEIAEKLLEESGYARNR